MMLLFIVFILFAFSVFIFVFFKIRVENKKLILVGLGTSGLNVTTKWIDNGGKGFALMENVLLNSFSEQYTSLNEVLKKIKKKRYVVVSGLGGNAANLFLLELAQCLERKSITFY